VDLSKRTDKGKSSHVSFVESPVTSHKIADRNSITIKAPHVTTKGQQVPLEITLMFDKHDKKKVPSGWLMIGA
jgi:uncharacterized lipoprotein YbaY